ncbi:hypothetical protein [Labilithrix luteola]|nr:hypothetical protein [Labilithrix luteola]
MSVIDSKQAAARHLPVARGRERNSPDHETRARLRRRSSEARHSSETRLQAAVVRTSKQDDVDPYFDVPCTD